MRGSSRDDREPSAGARWGWQMMFVEGGGEGRFGSGVSGDGSERRRIRMII